MRPLTAAERAALPLEPGPPRPDAPAASYRDLEDGPLPADARLSSLARMPGPAALRRLLREGAAVPLAPPSADRMFADDVERIWAWPGARDFGVVLLLDPWPLSPVRARGGGYIVDARAAHLPGRTVYAPDAECASLAQDCDGFAEARARMPSDWSARIDEALARVDRYVREVESLREALDALAALAPDERDARLAEHGLAPADAARPVFTLPVDRRERLRDLARAAGWLMPDQLP